jgi:hypothetical protein
MAPRTVPSEFAKYWPIIRSTTMGKLSTAETWAKIRQWEAERGIERPVGIVPAISQLRSLGAQARIASEKLAALPNEAVIAAEHISPEINARPLNEQALAPKYIARFQVTVATAAGEALRWLSVIFHGRLPTTKGQLMQFLTLQAPSIGVGSEEFVIRFNHSVQLVAQ